MNEKRTKNYHANKITFTRLGQILISHFWLLLISTVIMGGCGFIIAKFAINPVYTAETQIVVNQKSHQGKQDNNNVQADIQMVNTYKSIATNPSVLQSAKQRVKVSNLNVKKMKKMIKIETDQNSQAFTLEVKTSNPSESVRIANAVAQSLKAKVVKTMHLNNITIISPATLPNKPSFPKPLLFAAAGMIIGFLGSLLYILIDELNDTTIRNKDYIESKYNLHHLGDLPHLKQD